MNALRFARVTLCGLWVLFLAACANTAAVRTEKGLQLDLVAKPEEGFVVLRVVSLRPLSLLNPTWQSVHVTSQGKPDQLDDITLRYTMLLNGKDVPGESLYFAKLPVGRYEVTGLGSIGPGPGLILALLAADHADARQLPGFSVESGKLANLGTLVFSPEMSKEEPERMVLMSGPAGRNSALQALLAESKRADVQLSEGGGWEVQGTAAGEAVALSEARKLVSILHLRRTGQALVGGSHLGQVFRRSGPRTWTREAIDTLSTIFAVVDLPGGRVVAGGEHGQYFVRDDKGVWQNHRVGPQVNGRVIHIEPKADGSTLFVTQDLRETRIWAKKSLQDTREAATDIARIETGTDTLLVADRELLFARNIPGLARQTEIIRVAKDDLAVTTQPETFRVADWQQLQDGRVMLTRINGMTRYVSVSTDRTRTWSHIETPGWANYYWLDADRAVALDSSGGFVMVGNQLKRTADGGKTWKSSGSVLETRNTAARIVYASDDEVLLQDRTMLYSTVDDGKTWERVFPPATAR